MDIKVTVDARGLSCPMPIVKTKKAMNGLQSGEVLELLATDKGSANDTRAWVQSGGHTLLDFREEDGVFKFYIAKA
ncbi:MAG TPA: sulfurtransferase TusA family protein [Symbiobacteriaceae bacterium]|nr:sulfurtransferase TusA family protein [Symbiobacteriaceae bacterium]